MIEIIIVLAILAIVMTIVMLAFNPLKYLRNSRDSKRKSNLDQLKKAFYLYKNDFGIFPESNEDNEIIACGSDTISWGQSFKCGTMVYMKQLPLETMAGYAYNYEQIPGSEGFCLWATMENQLDSQIDSSKNRCPECLNIGDYDYVVCGD